MTVVPTLYLLDRWAERLGIASDDEAMDQVSEMRREG